LRAETDNFRTALAWWLYPETGGTPSAEQATRLATALWRFWYEQGHWTEGREWLMRALAAGEEVTTPVRARALNTAGMAALFQGEYEESGALLTESLELFRNLGSKHGVASALTYLGYMAAGEMDASRTRQLLDEASLLLPHLTHPSVTAYLVSFLGVGHASLGDSESAIGFLEEGTALFRKLEDSRGTRQCLTMLGITLLEVGDLPRARATFRESIQLSRRSRDVLVLYFCLLGLAGSANLGKQLHRAARLWGAADRLRQVHGLHLNLHARTAIHYDDAVAGAHEQLGEAIFAAVWEEGMTMRLNQAIDYALEETDALPISEVSP
jgi:non-specific serine/threonine protein kinase